MFTEMDLESVVEERSGVLEVRPCYWPFCYTQASCPCKWLRGVLRHTLTLAEALLVASAQALVCQAVLLMHVTRLPVECIGQTVMAIYHLSCGLYTSCLTK